MDDLIARLEAADEDADWDDLSAEIMQAVEGFVTNYATPYTTSVDAALALIPDGWTVFHIGGADGDWDVGLIDRDFQHPACKHADASEALTLPVALCIAALKARMAA